jgi:hypothetical protein
MLTPIRVIPTCRLNPSGFELTSVMLSRDNGATAKARSRQAGITEARGNLLHYGKVLGVELLWMSEISRPCPKRRLRVLMSRDEAV